MSEKIHLDEHQVRLQKLTQLKDAGVIPYANKFDKRHSTADLVAIGSDTSLLQDIDVLMQQGASQKYTTAGRLMMFRSHGKLSFGTIRDNLGDIQISFVRGKCAFNTGKEAVESLIVAGSEVSAYKFVEKFFDIGDFIGVKGDLFVTKHGELTLFVDEYQMLSKALRPLGDKRHGIKDEEAMYRQRYLDMTMNQESYNRFVLKSEIVKEVRKFYWSQGFHEIETSVLGNSASGTAAQPFVTHHNAYDLDVYLRVATEPQNKMATVGRFEKVFEIGKDFRNEGIDPTHLQEFTMIEHYAVYWNYEDNMRFTEELFDHLFKTLDIPVVRNVKNKAGEIKAVDFTTPRQRIDYIDQIQKDCGIDVSKYGPEDEEELRKIIKEQGHERNGLDVQATATMIDYLYKKVTRPQILGPAFIYNYPKTMQPLARRNDENQGIVEQFQLIVNGVEILKAYSELVDPIEQQSNFDEQKAAQEKGDEETTAADSDFVLAMEHGMPPQSGWGMGIERLCAILMEQDNLRDVTMFPLMKPLNGRGVQGNDKNDDKAKDISFDKGHEKSQLSYFKTQLKNISLNSGWDLLKTIEIGKDGASGWKGKLYELEEKVQPIFIYNGKILIFYDELWRDNNLPRYYEGVNGSLERGNNSKITDFIADESGVKVGRIDIILENKKREYIKWHGIIIDILELPSFEIKYNDGGYASQYKLCSLDEAINLFNNQVKNLKSMPDKDCYGLSSSITSYVFLKEIREKYPDIFLENKETAYGFEKNTILAIVNKYLTDTKLHCEQVGFVMKEFAKQLGEDEQLRHSVGILHDIDRDHIGKVADDHLGEQFDSIMDELGADEHLRRAIQSHYPDGTGVQPQNLLEKYLISVDELTGFLYAYARMRPQGYEGMKRKSINKKIKDKQFAAGVDREHLRNCEQYLGIPLAEFALSVVSLCNHQDFPTV